MKYISSQSYHALNHWQSNKRVTHDVSYITPFIFCGCYYDSIWHPQNWYKLDGWSEYTSSFTCDIHNGSSGSYQYYKQIPETVETVEYIEDNIYNGKHYYVVLTDKISDAGLYNNEFNSLFDSYTPIKYEGKNCVISEDGTIVNYSNNGQFDSFKFGSGLNIKVNYYSMFIIEEGHEPSWLDTSKIDYTNKIETADYYREPFNINSDGVMEFTPLSDLQTGEIKYRSSINNIIKPISVREDTYSNVTNSVSWRAGFCGAGGLKKINDVWCCGAGTLLDKRTSGYYLYNGIGVRIRYRAGQISEGVYSTYIVQMEV